MYSRKCYMGFCTPRRTEIDLTKKKRAPWCGRLGRGTPYSTCTCGTWKGPSPGLPHGPGSAVGRTLDVIDQRMCPKYCFTSHVCQQRMDSLQRHLRQVVA